MASRKRTKKTVALAIQSAPPDPPREAFVPEWAQRKGYDGFINTSYVRSHQVIEGLREGRFRLPRFQRPYVWTDEQVLFLLDSMRHGYHFGELLLWQRYDMPATIEQFNDVKLECPAFTDVQRAMMVVDGQQRLGALATAALSGRFYLNLLDGSVVVSAPKAWHVPMGFVFGWCLKEFWVWCSQHCVVHGIAQHDVMDAFASAHDVFNAPHIGYVELPAEWSLERVLESYRRLNTCGTPMNLEHLGEGLHRVMAVLGQHLGQSTLDQAKVTACVR